MRQFVVFASSLFFTIPPVVARSEDSPTRKKSVQTPEGARTVALAAAQIADEIPGDRISKQGDWPAITYAKDL